MMMRILLLLFCAVALSAHAEDWPTWRYDVERTAESPQVLADNPVSYTHLTLPTNREV